MCWFLYHPALRPNPLIPLTTITDNNSLLFSAKHLDSFEANLIKAHKKGNIIPDLGVYPDPTLCNVDKLGSGILKFLISNSFHLDPFPKLPGPLNKCNVFFPPTFLTDRIKSFTSSSHAHFLISALLPDYIKSTKLTMFDRSLKRM